MITELTAEQTAQLEVYRNKWLEIGLRTGPCDFKKCVKYAKIAYKMGGVTAPKDFYQVKGPLEGAELMRKLTGEPSKDISSGLMFGNHDANWLGYYEYFWKVLGIKECSIIEGLVGIAENCGWWYGYDAFAIFQDRPVEIHRDAEHRLHREDGPAISYADGLKVYAIDGYRLTEQIVMKPETLTVDQINGETNGDIQSIMLDRFGWHNYIERTSAKLIDFRDNDVEFSKEALYNCGDKGKRLIVTCPTGRVFAKGVPNSVNSCEEAQRWLGNDVNNEFNVVGRN